MALPVPGFLTSCPPKTVELSGDWGTFWTSRYRQVAVGSGFGCAIKHDASIACFGLALTNEIHDAWASIAAGPNHLCAVAHTGVAQCWDDGTLNAVDLTVPPLEGFTAWVHMDVGQVHACGVITNGSIACWGDGLFGHTDVPDPPPNLAYIAVGCGQHHTCGLLSNGEIVCWGSNLYRQLDVPAFSSSNYWVSFSVGLRHTCGILVNGFALCWGDTSNGRSTLNERIGIKFLQVSVYDDRGCAITQDHSVLCFDDSPTPTALSGSNWVSVSVGDTYACLIDDAGLLNCVDETWSPAIPTIPGLVLGPCMSNQQILLRLSRITLGPTSFPEWALSLRNLYSLVLSDNQLTGQVVSVGTGPGNLLELDLRNNKLSGDLSALTQFIGLSTVLVNNNHLQGSLFDFTEHLSSLRMLSVSNNQLVGALPDFANEQVNLTSLDLSNNQLNGTIPMSFSRLRALARLDLSNNEFSGAASKAFSTLSNLLTVDLSNNQLTTMPRVFSQTLSYYNLSFNRIESTLFPSHISLRTLDLSHNKLTVMETPAETSGNWSIFRQIPLLRTLDVSFNDIAAMENDALTGLRLNKFFAAGNPLLTIGSAVWDALQGVEDLDLQDTPLVACDVDFDCFGEFTSSSTLFCARMRPGDYCILTLGPHSCPAGHQCPAGNAGPQECPAGMYAPPGSPACLTCPLGRYTSSPQQAQCKACEPGFACSGGERSMCAAGNFSLAEAEVCSTCPDGRFTRDKGQSSCNVCQPGHSCQSGVMSVCPAGRFAPAEAVNCSVCTAGEYTNRAGEGSCLTCEPGYECVNGQRTACGPGEYSEGGPFGCRVCSNGTYAAGSPGTKCEACDQGHECFNGMKRRCDAGTYAAKGSDACQPCGPGFYTPSDGSAKCEPCPAGYACDGTSRTACRRNEYSSDRASSCLSCPSGKYANSGSSQCSSCSPGFIVQEVVNDNSSLPRLECVECVAGTYYHAASSSCLPCPLGNYCRGRNQAPEACDIGRFSDGPGQAECALCPPGRYGFTLPPSQLRVEMPFSCGACPSGRYSPHAASAVCTVCPAGYVARPLTGSTEPRASLDAACAACNSSEALCNVGVPFRAEALVSTALPGVSLVQGFAELEILTLSETSPLEEGEGSLFVQFSFLAFFIAAMLGLLTLVVALLARKRMLPLLARIDIFALERPLKPREYMQSIPTAMGGLVTIVAMLLVLAAVVNTAWEYFGEGNRVHSSTLLPIDDLNALGTDSFSLFTEVMIDNAAQMDMHAAPLNCSELRLMASDERLRTPRCREGMKANAQGNPASCVCTASSPAPYVIPFSLDLSLSLPTSAVALNWFVRSEVPVNEVAKVGGAYSLRVPGGIPSGVDISLLALPVSHEDVLTALNSSGYSLIPVYASYREPIRADLNSIATLQCQFSVEVTSQGKLQSVVPRLTPLQAVSSCMGLVVGMLGGLRIALRLLRRGHRVYEEKKQGAVKQLPPVGKGKQASGGFPSGSAWTSNPIATLARHQEHKSGSANVS